MHRLKWNSVDLHAQIKLLNDFELWMIDFDVTEFSAWRSYVSFDAQCKSRIIAWHFLYQQCNYSEQVCNCRKINLTEILLVVCNDNPQCTLKAEIFSENESKHYNPFEIDGHIILLTQIE